MSTSAPPSLRLRIGTLIRAILFIAAATHSQGAETLDTRNAKVWKLRYGVTDAQMADPNWLSQDSDGDGINNGVEMLAGTDPFSSAKTIKVSSMSRNAGNVTLSFPTEAGKRYRAESTTTLRTPNIWALESTEVTGDGATKSIIIPSSGSAFYRIRIDDKDSDGDGVSDWAERTVSLNPITAQTIAGTNDVDYLDLQLALPSVLTISAPAPLASEDGPVAGKFTLTRSQNLFPLTVDLKTTGSTAVPGSDYSALPASVSFDAQGALTMDLFVNPIVPQLAPKGGRSVTLTPTRSASGGFPLTLSGAANATVIINSSTVPSGTGLLGRYYDTSNATQADAANFGQSGTFTLTRVGSTPYTGSSLVIPFAYTGTPALQVGHQVKLTFTSGSLNSTTFNHLNYTVTDVTPGVSFTVAISGSGLPTSYAGTCSFSIQSFPHPAALERVDPTVNFDWQYGTPNAVTIAPNNPADNYSAAWETYLQPSTAGNYIFQLDADTKARVLLDTGNGLTQILEHNWTNPGADPVGTFKQSASIPLVVPSTPAQRYKMRVEHVETTGDARCRLQWNVNGGSFANIPQANQFTHTQTLSYSFTAGNAVITPSGGHTFNVGDSVSLAFSSGILFTPGAASTHNKTYAITAVNGTTTYTVAVTGFPITVSGATTAAGSPFINVPSTAGLAVGMSITGTGLPAGEVITAIGTGFITVTTGTAVTAQTATTLTAVLPSTGTTTGSGFVLNNSTSTTTGLYNLLYPNTTLAGSPGRVGVDSAVTTTNNGIWGAGTPDAAFIQPETFSARWTGQVQPQFSEEYTFVVQADDGVALWINGQPQALRMLPSALTGGSAYTYDSTTGDLVVNYSALAAPAGSFAPGEIVRIDPSSSNLSHSPTNSPTYDYDAASGILTVDYTNLVVGQAGGTRTAGSYAVNETVELDPTSGGLSSLSALPYVIQSVSANTFTVNVGALSFSPATTISSISATSPCQISTVQAHGLSTGAKVRITGVTGGTFSSPINAVQTVTVIDSRTFSIASNCTAAPTAGTGLLSAAGNITVSDNRNQPITALQATGTGTYSYNATTGDTVIDYSALTGVPANTIQPGQKLALDPTSGNLNALASSFYTVTAATATTFTVNYGTGTYATGTGNITIVTPSTATVPAGITNAFTVNIGAGAYANNSTGNVSVDIAGKPMKDWNSNGNERYVRIPLLGGVRYDIQLDFFENTNNAKCVLSWLSASQPKQVIPAERLYPSNLSSDLVARPAHVSPTDASALVNGPFAHSIALSNGATASVSGNPAWLTFNSTTGMLSGTPPAGAAGDYQILITLRNAAGTSTSVLNLHVDENTGSVVRELWSGIAGTTLSTIPTGSTAASSSNITSLEGPTDSGDNYGTRIRGYLTAPTTGNYYFWISGNNAAELWISNDSEPVNAFKRAWVTTGTASPRAWNTEASRKSPWLALDAGQKYYFEILHKAGVAGDGVDNLAVGWAKPGDSTTAPSEVVPGYALSPYVAPAAGSTPGTLFVSTMLSQSGAATNGVGGSTLRLSDDESTAYMKYNYSGLSGPITSQHIHTDPYLTKPATIVYDIDTPANSGDGLITNPADPNYGSYKWTITAVGTLTKADILEILREGKAYINLHTAAYPAGEIRGNYTLAQGTRTFSPPPAPLAWTDDSATNNGASRFLAQASFGANIPDIASLKALSASGSVPASGIPTSRYNTWIEDQFTKPAASHLSEVRARELADVFGSFDVNLEFNTWWKTAVSGQDQLRQRVAFALSQIHVVSGQGPLADNALALAHFHDTLAANAFGNFRDILIGTTLTPAMGRYLDMLGNDKPDPSLGRSANENYAREIKQLFSIGLYRMWPDGTLMLTSKDSPIDTYSQREVVGLAQVFTGWYYGYDGPALSSFSAPADWTRPMRVVPARHYTGPKRVLNNEVLPGLSTVNGQGLDPFATHISANYTSAAYQALPVQELNAVHDMLFNHPNTGPFICRQLIQRMVTSNPSRDYLYRVVQKFNDNGSGVRGDMKAVLKAILLDYEARSSDLLAIPAYGKQREPVLRIAHAARALRPTDVSGTYSQSGTNLITISTGTTNPKLAAGNSVFLEFTDTTGDPAKPAPTAGTYTVVSANTSAPYSYTVAAPGWYNGSYSQTGTAVTVTMSGHYLPGDNANASPAQVLPDANHGRAYFDFTSGSLDGLAGFDKTVQKVLTSNSYDVPSTVSNSATLPSLNGNYSGTTFTLTAPDSATRSGNVMIARFPGSYSCTGRNGVITIDTSISNSYTYGQQADHGLSVGDTVFLNFTGSRDTTSFNETSTENDLVYTVLSVPDSNTFTVAARDAANAAMNSDNQVVIFPLKTQPLTRSGTVSTRQSTFTMDSTDTDLQQTPLNSTTVFNFFLPDYKFSGALASQGITTPEFQLTSETSVINQSNFVYNGIFNPSNTNGISSFKGGTNALILDFTPWMAATAADLGLGAPPNATVPWTHNQNLSTLLDQMATLLGSGQLSASAKTVIKNFVSTPITSIGLSSSACTVTTTSAHNLNTGDSVLISGITDGTFGGVAGALNSTTTPRSITKTGTNTFTIPLACTVVPTTTGMANAHVSAVQYNQGTTTPTDTHKRDRLRAIVHLILTSPDFTIQR